MQNMPLFWWDNQWETIPLAISSQWERINEISLSKMKLKSNARKTWIVSPWTAKNIQAIHFLGF